MRNSLYSPEHEQFRSAVRAFIRREAVPNVAKWEEQRRVDIEFYRKAGQLGILGLQVPATYGGGGQTSFTYNLVVAEELIGAHLSISPLRVHIDVVVPYFLRYATVEQKDRWLGDLATGQSMASIAMSEPETGSDLGGIRTTARRDGNNFIINGAKNVYHRWHQRRPGDRRRPDVPVRRPPQGTVAFCGAGRHAGVHEDP